MTAEEALNDKEADKWRMAMDSEINSHKVNITWTLQNLPKAGKLFNRDGFLKENTTKMIDAIKYGWSQKDIDKDMV